MPRSVVGSWWLLALVAALVVPMVPGGGSALAPPPSGSLPLEAMGHATASAPGPGPVAPNATARLGWIHDELRGRNVPPSALHLPALSAEGLPRSGPVAPTYAAAPAPMGVADIGLRNEGGVMAPYELNTTSAAGTIDLTGARSVYVDGDGPDMFGVQLNSVLTNVTLFGNSSYQFWTQNFVSYTSSSGQLSFGDNLWNFSDPFGALSANAIYAHGPNGTPVAPVYYYALGPTFTIHYPFSVTFYLNATTIDGRSAVYFNYTVANATMSTSGSFDWVVFNSTAPGGGPAAPVPQFQIDGFGYDPIGLINDIELVVCGNDNGDTTTFFSIAATLSLEYWNASTGRYANVPSAMNAGADTGETADGVASFYTTPTTTDQLALGPSFLTGLWNSTDPPGERSISISVNPAAALLLVNPGTSRRPDLAQWVPSSPTGLTFFYVPNTGNYYVDVRLGDFVPGSYQLHSSAPPNQTQSMGFGLAPDPALGLYTPLIIQGNAELAQLAPVGSGTANSPYILLNNGANSLDPEFAQWNDFEFPVFPGLLLIGTTAHVQITPPALALRYPAYMLPQLDALGLPADNHLQIEFWNASNVSLLNASGISGWLSASMYSFYPLGSVIFWNSSHDLIARNTFEDQGAGLAMYGGTGNTIWGNSFVATPTAALDPANLLGGPANQTGLWESESGDQVYNNYFATPVTAYTPSFDPLSCQTSNCSPATYTDAWNVSEESASAYQIVLGQNLTGSIIGTPYQGGNYWSNYGTWADPFGALPYNDSGWIASGGDFVPLVPYSLFNVSFQQSGLAPGTPWGVSTPFANVTSTGWTLDMVDPAGPLSYSVWGPPGYLLPPAGSVSVPAAGPVLLSFLPIAPLEVTETGLAAGLAWNLSIVGTGTGGVPENVSAIAPAGLTLRLPVGGYDFTASSTGFVATPGSGSVEVTSGATPSSLAIVFSPALALGFSAVGLPAGSPWSVNVTQGAITLERGTNGSSILFGWFDLPDPTGSFEFSVSAPGFLALPAEGQGILPANAVETIHFARQNGTLNLSVVPACSTLFLDGASLGPVCGTESLSLEPGTYSLEATGAGYLPSFDNVSVFAGTSTTVTLHLRATPPGTSSPQPTAGPTGVSWGWVALLAALAAVFLATTLLLAFRARRRPPTAPAASPRPAAASPRSPPAVPAPVAPPAAPVPERQPWSEDESP
jgi:thermopsin